MVGRPAARAPDLSLLGHPRPLLPFLLPTLCLRAPCPRAGHMPHASPAPRAAPQRCQSSRRRDVTARAAVGLGGGAAGWPAGGGAGARGEGRAPGLRGHRCLPAPCPASFPALPASGIGGLALRGTAASRARPLARPLCRSPRRLSESGASAVAPGGCGGAGPVRSWCCHDAIAGQEGQVGRKTRAPSAPGAECSRAAPPPPQWRPRRRGGERRLTGGAARSIGTAGGGRLGLCLARWGRVAGFFSSEKGGFLLTAVSHPPCELLFGSKITECSHRVGEGAGGSFSLGK